MDFQKYPTNNYGPSNGMSMHVENGDNYDQMYARRLAKMERARAAARVTQEAILDNLSNATSDEYQDDILDHMEKIEVETLPDLASIEAQPEIRLFMRPYLLDFLIEAHAAFQLIPETLHLAVNLLDRYCSRRIVYKRHYQLVGCAALLIAAKYGDRKERVPTIRELKSMCCALYEEEMFTQMEWHVLATLDWAIGHPTVDSFLQMAYIEDPCDSDVEHMTGYLCEMSLYSQDLIQTRPSVMARTALALARYILGKGPLSPSTWSAQYEESLFITMAHRCQTISDVLAKKYSSAEFSGVAHSLQRFLVRQSELAQQAMNVTTPIYDMEYQPGSVSVHTDFPHTPQKGSALRPQSYGIMTPPITPDGINVSAAHRAAKAEHHHSQAPETLTPPSTVMHSSVMHPQYYQHQPGHHMPPSNLSFYQTGI